MKDSPIRVLQPATASIVSGAFEGRSSFAHWCGEIHDVTHSALSGEVLRVASDRSLDCRRHTARLSHDTPRVLLPPRHESAVSLRRANTCGGAPDSVPFRRSASSRSSVTHCSVNCMAGAIPTSAPVGMHREDGEKYSTTRGQPIETDERRSSARIRAFPSIALLLAVCGIGLRPPYQLRRRSSLRFCALQNIRWRLL